MSRQMHDFVLTAHDLVHSEIPFVTVTLVLPEGHVPQDIGAKAIITSSGLIWGTVGGGRLEAQAIQHATTMLKTAKNRSCPAMPEMVRYNLQKDLNMVCGGFATLFYEVANSAKWTIAVFGAGHVVQATIPILTTLNCQLICADSRPEWLAKLSNHPRLVKLCVENLPEAVAKVPENSFYVVITQGYATDLPVIREILKRGKPPFLGVIGSMPKWRKLSSCLLEESFSAELVNSIQCPIGIPMGSNAPAEVAISIVAQLIQKRDEMSM